jgi:hypothetical protein
MINEAIQNMMPFDVRWFMSFMFFILLIISSFYSPFIIPQIAHLKNINILHKFKISNHGS